MKFSVFQLSRKGARAKNEDRMGYCYTNKAVLLMLADGMGGHPEGEVAAQLAIDTLASLFRQEAKPELVDAPGFLERALQLAHQRIVRYASDRAMLESPLTTLVAAVIQNGFIHWTHCGDSRLYLLRQSQLLVRTCDHSLLEQDRAEPWLLRAQHIKNRHTLYTCLGAAAKPLFALQGPLCLQPNDRVMLCSDGLWSALPEPLIVAQLTQQTVDVAVPSLVTQALLRAGASSDNVTCLALAWQTPNCFELSKLSEDEDETLAPDFFASRIPLPAGAQGLTDDLDEQYIERSIAEINAAIARAASYP